MGETFPRQYCSAHHTFTETEKTHGVALQVLLITTLLSAFTVCPAFRIFGDFKGKTLLGIYDFLYAKAQP